jgi:FtsZ-binding cell division protein ZapB
MLQTARGPAVSTGAVATAQYIVAELTKQLRKKDDVIKAQQERIESLENQVREASIIKAGEGLASVDASLLKDELREADETIEELQREVQEAEGILRDHRMQIHSLQASNNKLRKELAHANLAIENFRRRHLKVTDRVWQSDLATPNTRSSRARAAVVSGAGGRGDQTTCSSTQPTARTDSPGEASAVAIQPMLEVHKDVDGEDSPQTKRTDAMLRQVVSTMQAFLHEASGLDTLNEVENFIGAQACKFLQAERCHIYHYSQSDRSIVYKPENGSMRFRVQVGHGIVSHVCTSGKTVRTAAATSHRMFVDEMETRFNFKTKSLLCTPIHGPEGTIIGALEVHLCKWK